MNDGPGRDWWELVEEHLVRGDHLVDDTEGTDDPWRETGDAPALTDAQRERLAGIDDQPGVARFGHHDHEHDDQPPVPRFAAGDDDRPGPTTGNIPGDSP